MNWKTSFSLLAGSLMLSTPLIPFAQDLPTGGEPED